MEDNKSWDNNIFPIDLDSFFVSERYSFLLEDPLTDLPEYYQIWMDLAHNVTHLIQTHQLRDLVDKMPLLSAQHLDGHRQLRLAHLALGFITMGYVWQEGEQQPAKVLPKSLAVPYCGVSETLGLPPIFVYADFLANWRFKDPNGAMEIGNLDTLFSFPGGDSCKGFFLVSLMVEKDASLGIQGAVAAMNAMLSLDIKSMQKALHKVSLSLQNMRESFKLMHSYVDPKSFHGILRIFFSGWRDNPMLPEGLLYEGVSEEARLLSGGSAAQSPAIQSFDRLLDIQHEGDSASFLARMQDYMPPAHRQLLQVLARRPSLRALVLSRADPELRRAYNACVAELLELRGHHLNVVARYITVPGSQARAARRCPLGGALNERGTGGTSPLVFLKSVRDSTRKALIIADPHSAPAAL